MENLHTTVIAENGKIIINVPESFNGKELEITISEKSQLDYKFQNVSAEERLKILKQFEGSAKYPDILIDKDEWYEQAGDY